MSLDLSQLPPYVPIAIFVGAAIAVATFIFKFKRKKPKLALSCTDRSWRMRQPTSIVTDIYATLLLQNKGVVPTTVNTLTMAIEYHGTSYPPVPSELDNIMLVPGASIPKQFRFLIPRDQVVIRDTIEKATITVKHTHGSKKIEIIDIPNRQ